MNTDFIGTRNVLISCYTSVILTHTFNFISKTSDTSYHRSFFIIHFTELQLLKNRSIQALVLLRQNNRNTIFSTRYRNKSPLIINILLMDNPMPISCWFNELLIIHKKSLPVHGLSFGDTKRCVTIILHYCFN